jgi:hypothetical protein
MTLTEHALRGSVLVSGREHRLEIGLPWYRSMPFSSIVEIDVRVDDTPVAPVQLGLDDEWLPVDALSRLRERYWFVQDRHRLRWRHDHSVAATADVAIRMRMHLPFLAGPDGSSLQVLQEISGVVSVREGS